jgi:hypothetical protein
VEDTQVANNIATITINTTKLAAGESVKTTLQVTDTAGNTQTQSKTISIKSNNNGGENKGGSSSGGGGGGGVGGGGVGSGGGTTADPTTPPTFAEIESALNFVTPETQLETKVNDIESSENGVTVTPKQTSTVRSIQYNNRNLNGKTTITEYGTPPSTIREEIKHSAARDVDTITTDVNKEGDVTASNINVLSVTQIEPKADATEDQSATVTLQLPKSAVDDPERISIIKEEYIFSEQKTQWKDVDEEVVNKDEKYVVTTNVDKFSLFAIIQTDKKKTNKQSKSQQPDPTQTEDGIPGFGIVTTIIGIFALVASIARKDSKTTQ